MTDNILQFNKELPAEDHLITTRAEFDMRGTIFAEARKFIVPASAEVNFHLNELGVVSVYAEWSSATEFEIQEGLGSNLVYVMPANRAAELSPNITLMENIGSFDYEGRTYNLVLANLEDEYNYVVTLSPKWRDAGFAFNQKVKLPSLEHFISAHELILPNRSDDVTQLMFAVYLTFDSNVLDHEITVGVQPCSMGISTSEAVVYDDDTKVISFSHKQLSQCMNDFDDILEV